jgi:hypothetical protein
VLYQAVCAGLAEGCNPDVVCSNRTEGLRDAAEAIVAWRVSLCYGEELEVTDRETSDRAWMLVCGHKTPGDEAREPERNEHYEHSC